MVAPASSQVHRTPLRPMAYGGFAHLNLQVYADCSHPLTRREYRHHSTTFGAQQCKVSILRYQC